MNTAVVPILLLTCGLALAQPSVRFGRFFLAMLGVLAGGLTVLSGAATPDEAIGALLFLAPAFATILCLMIISVVAEQLGLFHTIAYAIAARSHGDGRILFRNLFITATIVGTVFTNDAAVLIFTPLIWRLMEEVRGDGWEARNLTPYYFVALYVANLAGALVISNPINLVVANIFDIGFTEYAAWMTLPALASALVTYAGLWLVFRRDLPADFRMDERCCGSVASVKIISIILGVTLVGFFGSSWWDIPTWTVALAGAVASLVLLFYYAPPKLDRVVQGVGWEVVIFAAGMFIISIGLRHEGITDGIGRLLTALAGKSQASMTYSASFTAAILSSVINNHPTANTMALAIQNLPFAANTAKLIALASLIGGDLGPKMLPIGSLAAMMWFRMLRDRGVNISYRRYIALGIPVTLLAVAVSVGVLNLESILWRR